MEYSKLIESATAADAGAQLLFSRNGQLLYAIGSVPCPAHFSRFEA